MKIRITYRSEVFIEGDSVEEIKSKFENADLAELNPTFVELVSIEDYETNEGLM